METGAPLAGRAQEILQTVVRRYIETGEPVGSRTISKQRNDGLSAASIRNVMADLADEGYLSQPHTSAGRVPTEKAFQHYVKCLSAGHMPAAEAERLRTALKEVPTVEARLECSSHMLTQLTRNMGIAAAMSVQGQALDQIELLPLPDRRVLIVLVTRDRMVRNRVVALDEPISAEDLGSIRNYLNRNFSGWLLGDARRELLRRIEHDRALYHAAMRKMATLCEKGLLEVDDVPQIRMEGASNLVGLDLHLTREKMRDLLQALEEKKRLVDILNRFLDHPPGALEVQVGLGEAHPAMKELVLIGMAFTMPGGLSAKIAVLGPMRMHYERALSAVLHIGRACESAYS